MKTLKQLERQAEQASAHAQVRRALVLANGEAAVRHLDRAAHTPDGATILCGTGFVAGLAAGHGDRDERAPSGHRGGERETVKLEKSNGQRMLDILQSIAATVAARALAADLLSEEADADAAEGMEGTEAAELD